MEEEHLLWTVRVTLRPAFFLCSDWNRVGAKIEIKSIGHVESITYWPSFTRNFSFSAQHSTPSQSLPIAHSMARPVTASARRAISMDLIVLGCLCISAPAA